MNKVITINLGGTAFQLEDAGYDALRAYLESARLTLVNNPDREEILGDIETAIGDKFRGTLTSFKNVVLAKEVQAVLEQMGAVADETGGARSAAAAAGEPVETSGPGSTASGEAAASSATAAEGVAPRKRLYLLHDGDMLLGVCNGLGAYFDIDPTWVRIGFVALMFCWGFGVVAYFVLGLVIPEAKTPEEIAAARGGGVPTAQDFIRRAKAGYYNARKSFPDRQARRAWKRRFKQDMREWRASARQEWGGFPFWHWQRGENTYVMNPGAAVALPLLSLLHGALVVCWICALISLLANGTVLGLALPTGAPVWVAILVLLIVYGMITWPLKAARRAFYFGGCRVAGGAWLFFVIDAAVWFSVVAVLLWLAVRHFPQAQDAIHNLPTVARDAADSVRDWWHSH